MSNPHSIQYRLARLWDVRKTNNSSRIDQKAMTIDTDDAPLLWHNLSNKCNGLQETPPPPPIFTWIYPRIKPEVCIPNKLQRCLHSPYLMKIKSQSTRYWLRDGPLCLGLSDDRPLVILLKALQFWDTFGLGTREY